MLQPNLTSHVDEYEYRKDKFFEYAYPEHRFDNEELDISRYRDLYDACYSGTIIDYIIKQMRAKLDDNPKPEKTTIILTNGIRYKEANDILQLLNSISSELTDPPKKKKYVILSPLGIDGHFYALAVHIEKEEKIKITIILHDPYGIKNSFEVKVKQLFQALAFGLADHFETDDIKFDCQNAPDDLQGFDYDASNCGALTIFVLQKYVEFALLDLSPDNYKISIAFDSLPRPELNKSLHKAFVLRLKLLHLSQSSPDDNVGFQNISGQVCANEGRKVKAKEQFYKLQTKVFKTAIEKYSSFIPSSRRRSIIDFIKALNNIQMIELLNVISEEIVMQEIEVISNSDRFSDFMKNILANFQQPIVASTPQEKLTQSMLTKLENQVLSFGSIGTSPIQPPQDCLKEQLKKVVLASDDYDEFVRCLESVRGNRNFSAYITEVLQALLINKHENPYKTWPRIHIISEGKPRQFVSIDSKIIDRLILEGADIFAKNIISKPVFNGDSVCSSRSCVEIIATLPPSFSGIALKHFPDYIGLLFCLAVQNANYELIRYFLDRKDVSLSNATLKSSLEIVGHNLPETAPMQMPRGGVQLRDPVLMQKLRLKAILKEEVIRLLDERLEQQSKAKDVFWLPQNPHIKLIWAVKAGDLTAVEELLLNGSIKNINMQNSDAINALAIALGGKHVDIACCLMGEGAKLCMMLSSGISPLHYALLTDDSIYLNEVFHSRNLSEISSGDFFDLLSYTAMSGWANSFQWLLQIKHIALNELYQHLNELLESMRIQKNDAMRSFIKNFINANITDGKKRKRVVDVDESASYEYAEKELRTLENNHHLPFFQPAGNKKDDLLLQLALWLSSIDFTRNLSERNLFALESYDVYYEVGNCLFEAVAGLDEARPQRKSVDMRSLAIWHIQQDKQLKERIADLARAENAKIRIADREEKYQNVDEYVDFMRQDKAWGTEIELVALARVLKRPIVVLTPANAYDQIIEEDIYVQNTPIFLNYVGDNHYVPLTFASGQDPKMILKKIREAMLEGKQVKNGIELPRLKN